MNESFQATKILMDIIVDVHLAFRLTYDILFCWFCDEFFMVLLVKYDFGAKLN